MQMIAQTDATDDATHETDNFMELFEESLKSIQEGEVIKGEIVQIDREYVSVDIGYKSEGQIPIQEFIDLEGNLTAKVGDVVDVLLESREDAKGTVILSKEKAANIEIWDEVKEVYENEGTIRGKIISRVNGGLSVDIGLRAFLPGSQIDLRPVRDMDALVGMEHAFKIVKYNKRRGNIVLSRRAILEAERIALREKTLELLQEGAVLDGTVKNIAHYGLFIDIDGIDGLVHVSDMSWGRIGHPSEMYQIGDEVKVKVLHFDRSKERVSLGIKQLTPDPWDMIPETYKPGIRITGTVTGVTDFGVFVELEEGIEGLVHVSELPKNKGGNPLSRFQVDDVIQTEVINVSREDKKIGLSIRKLEERSEAEIFRSYLNNHKETTSKLDEILREEMANIQRQTLAAIQKRDPE